MSQLFIDVTQLADWQGKLTGIPRVMNELTSRFAADDGCRLLVWNGNAQAFYEVTYEELTSRRTATSAIEMPVNQTVLAALKAKVKGLESRSRLARGALRYPKKVARLARPVSAPDPGITPVKGDVLFILWGAWLDPGYVARVKALHDEHGVRLAQIAYDMLPLVTPQFSGHSTEGLTHYAKTLYPLCETILCISKHTQADVVGWLRAQHVSAPPTGLIRLGDDFQFSAPKQPQDPAFAEAKLKGGDYLLCVGTIEARKNHMLLYYTYKLAKRRGVVLPRLVVVGRRGWLSDDIFTLMSADPEVQHDFIFLQNASDEELSWLYGHCQASIYPSFYEGWGLPVAESVARGVPCLASNTSSIPEIAGPLVNYFDPYSSDDCLAAIEALLQPGALKKAKEALKHYQPVSWDETHQATNAQIRKVLHGTTN